MMISNSNIPSEKTLNISRYWTRMILSGSSNNKPIRYLL